MSEAASLVGVRPVARADLLKLVELCVEHARYERASLDPTGLAERLEAAVFGPQARLLVWVVEDDRGCLRGYASAASEISTWRGEAFLHLDCLYLDAASRGRGLGRRLLDEVLAAGRALGLTVAEWQTPPWNAGAIRFYGRLGARGLAKVRFQIPIEDAVDRE